MTRHKRILHITPEAENVLAHIYRYSEDHWGKAKATAYLSHIESLLEDLCANPRMGQPRSNTNPEYYFFPSDQYWIVYLFDERKLHVIALIHQNMDISSRLTELLKKAKLQ